MKKVALTLISIIGAVGLASAAVMFYRLQLPLRAVIRTELIKIPILFRFGNRLRALADQAADLGRGL